MNNLSEAQIKNAITEFLTIGVAQGKWEFIRIQSGNIFVKGGAKTYRIQLAEEGYPDFVVFNSPSYMPEMEQVYFFEVKSATGKVSEVQLKMHTRLEAQSCRIFIVRSVEEVMEILE